MKKRAPDPREFFDSVVISDMHLGLEQAASEKLEEFLLSVRCNRLIINGDGISGELLNGKPLNEAQMRCLDALNRLIRDGVDVIYLPGNHDIELRGMGIENKTILGVTFKDHHVHCTEDGRKYYICHGDRFDHTLEKTNCWPKAIRKLGAHCVAAGLTASNAFDRVARKVVGRDVLLWNKILTGIHALTGVTRKIERAAVDFARKGKYNGVIFGHTHVPTLWKSSDGIVCANDGDWIESFAAIGITPKGDIKQIHWSLRPADWWKGSRADVTEPCYIRPESDRMVAQMHVVWPAQRNAA